MLDMGGAPSSGSDQALIRTVNASKNSKVQAVAFDFRVLLNLSKDATNQSAAEKAASEQMAMNRSMTQPAWSNQGVDIDVDRVQQVAELLNVQLPSESKIEDPFATAKNNKPPKPKDHNPAENDIRAKYAAKLKGGLAGIELAKSQVKDTVAVGDAPGHLAARKIAIMGGVPEGSSSTANKWLASLEASQLLTLLTHRSIRIVLLPALSTAATTKSNDEENIPRMEDLKAQLKNVIIDKIVPKFENEGNNKATSEDVIEAAFQKEILRDLDLDPSKVLVVSDRDPYLRVAREMGMMLCRLQAKNARRGSITAHYTVPGLGDVQEVLNEINGISFNTVLNR